MNINYKYRNSHRTWRSRNVSNQSWQLRSRFGPRTSTAKLEHPSVRRAHSFISIIPLDALTPDLKHHERNYQFRYRCIQKASEQKVMQLEEAEENAANCFVWLLIKKSDILPSPTVYVPSFLFLFLHFCFSFLFSLLKLCWMSIKLKLGKPQRISLQELSLLASTGEPFNPKCSSAKLLEWSKRHVPYFDIKAVPNIRLVSITILRKSNTRLHFFDSDNKYCRKWPRYEWYTYTVS